MPNLFKKRDRKLRRVGRSIGHIITCLKKVYRHLAKAFHGEAGNNIFTSFLNCHGQLIFAARCNSIGGVVVIIVSSVLEEFFLSTKICFCTINTTYVASRLRSILSHTRSAWDIFLCSRLTCRVRRATC